MESSAFVSLMRVQLSLALYRVHRHHAHQRMEHALFCPPHLQNTQNLLQEIHLAFFSMLCVHYYYYFLVWLFFRVQWSNLQCDFLLRSYAVLSHSFLKKLAQSLHYITLIYVCIVLQCQFFILLLRPSFSYSCYWMVIVAISMMFHPV